MQTQISCPRCQSPVQVDVHQVIDAERNPQLKYRLLSGALNVFSCPNCGMSGQMTTPLLYHDPENEIFMVHVPMELNLPHAEQQKLIGQLVQEAMRNIPPEQRRGYMLQPQEVISYQTFMEKILETEGVTPEMLERQREQQQLLQELVQADKETTNRLLEESADQIDETFFAILHSTIEAAQQQNNNDVLIKLINLQARLYTDTEIGRELEKRQSALRAFQKEVQKAEALTPEILLKHVLRNREDEEIVDALIAMGQPAFNYQFFSLLTEEIEKKAKERKKDEAKALTKLRQRLLDIQNELQEESRRVLEGTMGTLQQILNAPDREQAIRDNVAEIDDTFMYVLSAMIAQAEDQGQRARAQDLRQVHELIVQEAERHVPPQLRIINRLISTESEAEQRRILEENRNLLTPELVEMLEALADEVGANGEAGEIAGRIRKIKAMVQARI